MYFVEKKTRIKWLPISKRVSPPKDDCTKVFNYLPSNYYEETFNKTSEKSSALFIARARSHKLCAARHLKAMVPAISDPFA